MRKRTLGLFLPVFVALITWQCNGKRAEPLPDFNILLLDSTTVLNTSQISEERPFILMYFSADCDHCQRETKDLLQYMSVMRQTRFYFVTANRFEELKRFNEEFKLTSYPNIVVGRDYELYIVRKFKNATPPYLAIYDKDKMQRAVFTGEHKANKIIEVLRKIED